MTRIDVNKELENMKKSELLLLAKQIGMTGFSRFTKLELVENVIDFVKKGGEKLEAKLEEIIGKSKNVPTQKTRITDAMPAPGTTGTISDKNTEEKELTKKTAAAGSKLKVQDARGNKEPDAIEDREASARNEMEKLRYSGTPLHARGQLITPDQLREIDNDLPDLPIGYGDNSIHLMPRDPRWLFCYWDINEETRSWNGKYSGGRIFLRLHDVTHISFDGKNSWSIHQFELNEEARWWYLPVPSEGRHFIAEIGYLMPSGHWNSIGFTDPVVPPPGGQSPWVHDVFVTIPFDEPLPLLTSPDRVNWLGENLPPRDSKPQIPRYGTPVEPTPYYAMNITDNGTSPSGVSSWVHIHQNEEHVSTFPLRVDADLRIFGGTIPEARLEINGKEVRLEKDGSFTLSLSFPDGFQRHVVTATGPNGEKKTITLTFQRHTS